MTPDPKLHHAAFRIVPNTLETITEMFELLGVRVQYRPPAARWVLVGQDHLDFSIQLIETDNVTPVTGPARINSQVSFISEDPAAHVTKIEQWAAGKNLQFVKGSWTERELWFDLPDLFTDSVIEVMHVSILND